MSSLSHSSITPPNFSISPIFSATSKLFQMISLIIRALCFYDKIYSLFKCLSTWKFMSFLHFSSWTLLGKRTITDYLLDLMLAASSDIRHQPILLDISFSVNWLEILSSSSVKWNRLYTLKFSKSKVKKSLSHWWPLLL